MDRYLRWLVRHPLVVLAGNLALTMVLGSYALGIRIENVLENVLPAGDPAIAYYDQVRATFGSDNVAVVGVQANDVLAASTLTKIARVTDAIARIQGIERVLSLTNAVDPAEDVISPPRLLSRIPPLPDEIEPLRRKLQSRALYGKNLVSDDFRGAAINVFLTKVTESEYVELGIDKKIQQVLVNESGPERFYYTGASHLQQAALEFMRRDLVYFTPIAVVVVLCVLCVAFRTARGVFLPVAAVLLALIWTLGIMALAGKALTIGTFVLPPLILVIGSAGTMHIMARYYEEASIDVPAGHTVERAMQRVWVPVLISALTTAVGFGSLAVSRIPAIRDLGIFAVVGLAALVVAMLTFLPATLQLLGVGPRGARYAAEVAALSRFLTRVAGGAYRYRRAVLAAAAAVMAATFFGAGRIQVDSDLLAYFEPESEIRRANETINQQIVGTNPFYLVIEGARPGLLTRWDALKQIKDLQAYLQTLPGITSSISLVDYLEILEAGLTKAGEGDLLVDEHGNLVPAENTRPFWEDPRNLEPLLEMVRASPKTFASVVTADFTKANIIVRTRLSGSRAIEDTLAKIRRYIAQRFPAELRVRPTGTLVLFTGTSSDIVAGQVESLSLALAVIFVVMALMFLSLKVGALAVLPNLLSIAIFFGLIGATGVVLNLGTSLIATIALGLAVDATIHYMARLNLELKGETDQQQAVVRALRAVGHPIAYTTLGLCLGFLTLGLSSFVPVQQFGLLTGCTLAGSLGANLIVLPALLATTKIITLWDLLRVKLGEDPARTIPLFAGLRPAQARIVVLMGEIKRFAPQELIVRRGQQSQEMFVIIQGTAEVWAGAGGERRRIVEHQRGDVFGEMGLVRKAERSADVLAVTPVEVLAVNEHFLRRIQIRYPRIAARVFLNLTRILSDRLQRMTDELVVASASPPQPARQAGS
jgi:predicted RND superfamily exporter protein